MCKDVCGWYSTYVGRYTVGGMLMFSKIPGGLDDIEALRGSAQKILMRCQR